MTATRGGIIVAAWMMAATASAGAQTPLSAIPWLSESLENTAAPVEPIAPKPQASPLGAQPITVLPLDEANRDAVGLLPPVATGFRRDLWGPTSAEAARAAILGHPGGGVPETQALFVRLLLAEANPPLGSDTGSGVLLARLDRLLEIGALDQAAALIELAGPDRPELFRRWFDIGLLTNDAAPPCEGLRQNPSLSATLPARVFCLARGGDWSAAEITLTLGEEVGSISPDQQAMLARFLDPELFETEPEPPVPDPLTPLDFLMREAVGLPRPPGPLPLAFLHQDLGEHVPMRIRIAAAERLALAGALEPASLHEAYVGGEPAASGSVWDRAKAVQDLDAALAGDGAPKEISRALAAADAALSERGLRVALARMYAEDLGALDPADFGPKARARLFELLALGGTGTRAADFAVSEPRPRQAVVMNLLAGAPAPAPDEGLAQDPVAAAAAEAFAATMPADGREQQLAVMLQEGRQGEAILAAIDLLAAGTDTAPADFRDALYTLRLAGQEKSARTIAAQTLLADDLR